jgi:micrococcal nuclease
VPLEQEYSIFRSSEL